MEALRYINSDTTLYSDVFFITLLDAIIVSSDDEIDGYKSDGNISDKNDLRNKIFAGVLFLHFAGLTDSGQWLL